MECKQFIFSGHAVRRMFERIISKDDVLEVVKSGEIIATYPDDTPFPSQLMLSFINGRAIHVVVSADRQGGTCYIITAYPPDLLIWHADFKARRTV